MILNKDEEVHPYDIDVKEPQKRLRVLGSQLLDDAIEDLTMSNFDFRVYVFLKQCRILEEKYPIHENHIDGIRLDFWEKAQMKYKKMKTRMDRIKDLKRMGFL